MVGRRHNMRITALGVLRSTAPEGLSPRWWRRRGMGAEERRAYHTSSAHPPEKEEEVGPGYKPTPQWCTSSSKVPPSKGSVIVTKGYIDWKPTVELLEPAAHGSHSNPCSSPLLQQIKRDQKESFYYFFLRDMVYVYTLTCTHMYKLQYAFTMRTYILGSKQSPERMHVIDVGTASSRTPNASDPSELQSLLQERLRRWQNLPLVQAWIGIMCAETIHCSVLSTQIYMAWRQLPNRACSYRD